MKQITKFGHTHSCSCSEKEMSIDNTTTEIIGCDFKNKTKEGFKGYLWNKSECKKCKGTILHGGSYADYRIKNEGLLLSAIQSCANSFTYKTFELLYKQFYKGKHFQSVFI